jgi:hypothetical protein
MKEKILKIYPKLHDYDGEVVKYNPIIITFYEGYFEINIDMEFEAEEEIEDELLNKVTNITTIKSLYVRTILSKDSCSFYISIENNVDLETNKANKEYTFCVKSTNDSYVFKVKNLKDLNKLFDIFKVYKLEGFNKLEETYEI